MRNVVNEDFLSHCATSGKRITVLCALLERRADKPREELSLSLSAPSARPPVSIYFLCGWCEYKYTKQPTNLDQANGGLGGWGSDSVS